MWTRYPIGYFFLGWFVALCPNHERIDLYFSYLSKMQTYLHVVQQELGQNAIVPTMSYGIQNAMIATQAISDFFCNCINAGKAASSSEAASTEVVLQSLMAAYCLLRGGAQIWQNKQDRKNTVFQMSYGEMMAQYPHLVLIEHQIKVTQLLIEMCSYGSVPEQIFGKIHLLGIQLPGSYLRYSKKQVKKLYKKYFDKDGRLISLDLFCGKYPYYKFHKKVSTNWHELVLNVEKYPTTFTLFFVSPYINLAHCPYNQTLLGAIDAGMHKDLDRVSGLLEGNNDPVALKLLSFYLP